MAKERELTPQQEVFLDSLFGDSEGNFREAMRSAGYSDKTTRAEIIKTLGAEIVARANGALALHTARAVSRLAGVLDTPNAPGNPNLIKAAAEILNRVGIQKAAEDVNLRIPSGGLVILPAKGSYKDESTESEE